MEKVPVGPSFNRASCRGATYRVAGLASGSGRSLLLYWSLRTARRRSSFDLHLRFSQNPREGSQAPPPCTFDWDDDLSEALRVSKQPFRRRMSELSGPSSQAVGERRALRPYSTLPHVASSSSSSWRLPVTAKGWRCGEVGRSPHVSYRDINLLPSSALENEKKD